MKKKNFLWIAMLVAGLSTSCSEENGFTPETAVKAAFENHFPGATGEVWSSKSGYSVVDFRQDGTRKSAWFSNDATLQQTETDIPLSKLPEAIKQTLSASEYATWAIDDIDLVKGNGLEQVYVVEVKTAQVGVKSGEQEMDLYFAEDGTLIKAVADTDEDDNDVCPVTPNPANQEILNLVLAKYPTAKVLEIDAEDQMFEVEFCFENLYYEMLFNSKLEWIETVYETTWDAVPAAIKDAFAAAGNVFDLEEDEVEVVDRPGVNGDEHFYRIELDREPEDLIICYGEDGTLIK